MTATASFNRHPLTWLSHMADVSLFGMAPGAHHLVSVLFHALNTLLVFHVLARMTGRKAESGFVAALSLAAGAGGVGGRPAAPR